MAGRVGKSPEVAALPRARLPAVGSEHDCLPVVCGNPNQKLANYLTHATIDSRTYPVPDYVHDGKDVFYGHPPIRMTCNKGYTLGIPIAAVRPWC